LSIIFGDHGVSLTHFDNLHHLVVSDITRQNDGKLVVVGFLSQKSDPELNNNIFVANYCRNGSLNNGHCPEGGESFGEDGIVTTSLVHYDGYFMDAFAVALDGQCGIIVVGRAQLKRGRDFFVARYRAVDEDKCDAKNNGQKNKFKFPVERYREIPRPFPPWPILDEPI